MPTVLGRECDALYSRLLAGQASANWWTHVVVTAGSPSQADSFRAEIRSRKERGTIPERSAYLVVPDPDGQRLGSGGATLNVLRALASETPDATESSWWMQQRVLLLHSGGESRRLPQYSITGKLFARLPMETPWGEFRTIFDETLVASTQWLKSLSSGLVIGSGDVLLAFDRDNLQWNRPGVNGVAIHESLEKGCQHGVYVVDSGERVYAFLQKQSEAKIKASGAVFEDGTIALDSGLLRFDSRVAARLTALADGGILDRFDHDCRAIDLYEHVTMALTGQWKPRPDDPPAWHDLARALHNTPFWCSVVRGTFTHVGTTRSFRHLAGVTADQRQLEQAQQQIGIVNAPELKCSGVVMDCIFSEGGEIGVGSIALECHLDVPVYAAPGAILHGLCSLSGAVEIPTDTVVHALPIRTSDTGFPTVVRTYGVADDPKICLATGNATWFGQPILDIFELIGLDPDLVWDGVEPEARSLWNAALFPIGIPDEAWEAARWLMQFPTRFGLEDWQRRERLSLASSSARVDREALSAQRAQRLQSHWERALYEISDAEGDLRPLLIHAPGIQSLVRAARRLDGEAQRLADRSPTGAASRHLQASLLHAQAGLVSDSVAARAAAYECVRKAVEAGVESEPVAGGLRPWAAESVEVSAPARIDLGGGWSDTPPFCIDWGGAVVNIAARFDGQNPIRTSIRRLREPLIRCVSANHEQTTVYASAGALLAPQPAGSPFSIPRLALIMAGLGAAGKSLGGQLAECGGGIEIHTQSGLPVGSGLGTSSIMAATVLRGLGEFMGAPVDRDTLTGQVMRLEQLMTTGGGWQDQAGSIYPGAKLLLSGPGLRQKIRVEPIRWSADRQADLENRLVLYYTGIRRIAKNLLTQIVGDYLARNTSNVQALHAIKTLALEMAHCLRQGEWDRLGELIDRHWQINQVLDPQTTNALINSLIERVRPYVAGAKLAGAGGGGFLILLAKSQDQAARLRHLLTASAANGRVYDCSIAEGDWTVLRDGSPVTAFDARNSRGASA